MSFDVIADSASTRAPAARMAFESERMKIAARFNPSERETGREGGEKETIHSRATNYSFMYSPD